MTGVAYLYAAGVLVMCALLTRQVVVGWRGRPLLEQARFVAGWSVVWPLVPCVWLMLWIEGDRDG